MANILYFPVIINSNHWMQTEKTIVRVNANFQRGEALFSYLSKYAQHTDARFAYWDEFAFTIEDLPGTGALLIFNEPSEKISLSCDTGKILAFMMEPGAQGQHPWMFKGLDHYTRVYSPLQNSANTVLSHGYLGWYFEHNWEYLSGLAAPEKTKQVSCIASGLKQLKGHRLRTGFINMLRTQMPQIDFFGRGSLFLPDKLQGLLPYRFSIAIENSSAPYYFTEKINDCFLAYTVPLYYGCKNIGKYFPEKSFVAIDIEHPKEAVKKIMQVVEKDDWPERLDALEEARQLVLNHYQPLAGAAAILREMQPTGTRQQLSLQPLPLSLREKIKRSLRKIKDQINGSAE
jgi:hypothetical protein